MKFALDRNFDSLKVKIPDSDKYFELRSFRKDEFILWEKTEEGTNEIYTFTKEELKVLWLMLTTK